jgi:hypothetical protein
VRAGVLALTLLAACTTQAYYLDLPDIDLDPPADLETCLQAFREGREPGHGDPRAVADAAIRLQVDVPWKGDRFHPGNYEVKESKEWGTYVVRGYVYPSGHEMRYRVKVRRFHEIWYAVQVSRYKIHEMPHPALEKNPGEL